MRKGGKGKGACRKPCLLLLRVGLLRVFLGGGFVVGVFFFSSRVVGCGLAGLHAALAGETGAALGVYYIGYWCTSSLTMYFNSFLRAVRIWYKYWDESSLATPSVSYFKISFSSF